MSTTTPALELTIETLDSASLRDDLLSELETHLPDAEARATEGPTDEQLAALECLCVQGAALAKAAGLSGAGTAHLHMSDQGEAQMVTVTSERVSTAQNLDPVALGNWKAEREQVAKARARKVVVAAPAPAPKPPPGFVPGARSRVTPAAPTSALATPVAMPASPPTSPPSAPSGKGKKAAD